MSSAASAPVVWEHLTPFEDDRGEGWSVPVAALTFLDGVREAHVVTITPGSVRGNHAHPGHRETLVVLFQDAWRLTWESTTDDRHHQDFDGTGAVVIRIDTGVPHAVRNTGSEPLVVVSISDRTGRHPGDTVRHTLE